jgi:hypothetical protein
MIESRSTTADDAEGLSRVLSEAQLDWVRRIAAAQTPPLSATGMLRVLVDEAVERHGEMARRREDQLEIYRASGYSEHHPDYPRLPRGSTDV